MISLLMQTIVYYPDETYYLILMKILSGVNLKSFVEYKYTLLSVYCPVKCS